MQKQRKKSSSKLLYQPESVVRPEGVRHLAGGNPVWKGLTSHQ